MRAYFLHFRHLFYKTYLYLKCHHDKSWLYITTMRTLRIPNNNRIK